MSDKNLIQKLDKNFLSSMDMVPHAIGIIDLNGCLVFINKYFEKTYNTKKEEVTGRHISEFYSDKEVRDRIAAFTEDVLTGKVEPGKFSDNADYPENSKYQEIQWDYLKINDQIEGIIYTSTNNDSKEQFERQLNESRLNLDLQTEVIENLKKKMRVALEAVNEGIWEWDLITDEVQYDDRYFEMLGYTREELESVDNIWRHLVHPDDIDGYNRQYEEFVNSRVGKYEFRYRYRNAAGEWLWILDKGQVVARDEEGIPTRIIGIHVDITDIMNKNEALERAGKHTEHLNKVIMQVNKDLKYTQRLLAYALKNARVGVWKWHVKEKVTDYDETSRSIFGFDPSYPKGNDKLFLRIHPDDRKTVVSTIEEYKNGSIPDFNVRYRVIKPDSRVVWVQEKGEVVEYDAKGSPELFLGSIRDITVQKEFEELLVKARDDAQLANNMKTELIQNVNHELRTPLTIIKGIAETMLTSEDDPVKIRFLNKILGSSQKLMNLIKEVLDLSKIENGRLSVRCVDFNLREFLLDYFTKIKSQAEKKSLDALLKIDDSVEEMACMDKIKLRYILNNLFSNAIKFTEMGEIGLCVRSDRENLTFEVYDTGIGIPKEKRPRIFEKFYQIDASSVRNYSGTGVGLSIVKELTEKMNGTILVEDYEAGGTKFIVSLPYKK